MTQEALAWDAHAALWQAITNELPIPPRRAQRSLPEQPAVTARIEWERDGVELVDTIAYARTERAVLVLLHDPRRQIIGVWLPTHDVTRR